MTEGRSASHPARPELRSYGDGNLRGDELFRVAWHVFRCQECRSRLRELGSWAEERHEELLGRIEPSIPESDYGDVTRSVVDRMRERLRNRTPGEPSSAHELSTELAAQPPARRRMLIENSLRFRNPRLVQLLFAECRKTWLDDPVAGEELARLALDVTDRLGGAGHSTALLNDFRCEAWSVIANCRRILSDFDGTATGLKLAEGFRLKGTGDPLEEASLISLRASFLRDQSRCDEALRAVDREIAIYREAGDRHCEGRALVRKSTILGNSRWFEEATQALADASACVDTHKEPRLQLLIRTNLGLCLAGAGRLSESRDLLAGVQGLADEVGSGLDRLRVHWIEGLVNRHGSEPGRAVRGLQTALDGFTSRSIPVDTALVSLDLAHLHLTEGRTSVATHFAREALPVFAVRNIHRETHAALDLLRQATA